MCAAKPSLQDLNGCWEEAPRAVAEYAGHGFTRCPRRYVDPRSESLKWSIREGYLKALPPREQNRLPAKRFEALRYGEDFLLKVRAAREVPRDD